MTVSPVRWVTAIAAVIAAAPLEAQEARERFELFNECSPVRLTVTLGNDDRDLPELTYERVRTLAESRLRAARLFPRFPPQLPFLQITVDVVGTAFSGRVIFFKRVYDPLSGVSEFTSTWRRGDTGTHRGGEESAAFIMQRLSELVDTFVLEYLRVNEESCTGAPPW